MPTQTQQDQQQGTGRLLGRVTNIFPDRGYCFVHADGQDYFAHASEIENASLYQIESGMKCTFLPVDGRGGKQRASAVLVEQRTR